MPEVTFARSIKTMSKELNAEGFEFAKQLIATGRIDNDLHGDWREINPDREAQNQFIEKNGWKVYSQWHLGLDPEADPNAKDAYSFPYGDFHVLHRSGLIAVEERAAQSHYEDIRAAAEELLGLLPPNQH